MKAHSIKDNKRFSRFHYQSRFKRLNLNTICSKRLYFPFFCLSHSKQFNSIKISLSELIYLTRSTKKENKNCCETSFFKSFHLIPNNDHIPTTLNLDILRQKDLWHLLPKTHKMFVKSILNDWFRKKQTKSFGIVWARRIRSNLKRIFLVNAWQNRNAFRLTFWPWIQGLAVIFRICTGSIFVCMHMMNMTPIYSNVMRFCITINLIDWSTIVGISKML